MVQNNALGLHLPKTRFFLDMKTTRKKRKQKFLLFTFRKRELLGIPRHTTQSTKICSLFLQLLIPVFAPPLYNNMGFCFSNDLIWNLIYTKFWNLCVWFVPLPLFLSKSRMILLASSTEEHIYLWISSYSSSAKFQAGKIIFKKAANLPKVFNFSFSSNHQIFQHRSLLIMEMWRTYCKIISEKS